MDEAKTLKVTGQNLKLPSFFILRRLTVTLIKARKKPKETKAIATC
jgi:hypothetical protein